MGSEGRRPSPLRRIITEMRDTFYVTSVISPPCYFLMGAYRKPKLGNRLKSGLLAIRLHAPKLIVATTLTSAMFSTTYFTVKCLRQKHDLFNQMAAGVATVAILDYRHYCLKTAIRSSLLLGPVAGLAIGMNLYMDDN